MAEGWKQLLEDLRGALGLSASKLSVPAREQRPPTPPSTPPLEPAAIASAAPPPGDGALSQATASSPDDVAGDEALPISDQQSTISNPPLSPLQRLYSYAAFAAALLVAVGVGWYTYFGPRPPAPDVVAKFDGGQITAQDVRDHLDLLAPLSRAAGEGQGVRAYETYRAVVNHMILNELVRRWAEQQQLDRKAKFADAMRHVSESLTLYEWVNKLHESEMMNAVRESDIQAYYEANRTIFGDATLSEVREQIRETLAHQN